MIKKKKPREYCIICGNKIFRSTNPQSIKPRRSILSVTCNSKCSKVYIRKSNEESAKKAKQKKKAKNNEKTKNRSSHQ